MIVVDTSVWIDYFRKSNLALKKELDRLILADQVLLPVIVKLEILTGLSKTNFTKIQSYLDAFPEAKPTDRTWLHIARAIQTGINHGIRFSVTDLTIGILAVESKANVWSLDNDFREMEKLGLVTLKNP
ncbi:MAG: PIN domain-containing protein [Spirochaetia bacterium]|nr:PIN domain-containing protein [Spirochaetia bacterium]